MVSDKTFNGLILRNDRYGESSVLAGNLSDFGSLNPVVKSVSPKPREDSSRASSGASTFPTIQRARRLALMAVKFLLDPLVTCYRVGRRILEATALFTISEIAFGAIFTAK